MRIHLRVGFQSIIHLACGLAFGLAPAADAAVPQDAGGWLGGHDVLFVGRAGPDGAVLRSGPNPNYGVVRRVDPGALLIAVARRDSEYVHVIVPDGYLSYVHSNYVNVDGDGHGTISSDRVNLRSQPSSRGDYPIGSMNTGTRVLVWQRVGDGDKWLQVTAPEGIPVWATSAELKDVGGLTPEIETEIQLARTKRLSEWEQRSAESASRAAIKREFARVPALLQEASAAIEVERKKGAEADFSSVRAQLQSALALETAEASLPPELRSEVDRLSGMITSIESVREAEQKRLALLDRLAKEERLSSSSSVTSSHTISSSSPISSSASKTPVRKPMPFGSRGRYTGFLRLRSGQNGSGANAQSLALERGSNVVAWVSCTNGRYRLGDYAGKQVVVHGTVTGTATSPVLDVDRLEIVP